MSFSRTYTVGLPVVITVNEDGTVEFEVDLSEADDLYESIPCDEEGEPLFSDFEVDGDQVVVSEATARINNNHRFTA